MFKKITIIRYFPELIAIGASILSFSILVNDFLLNKKFNGELSALTFTLIVVIWYTYYTYRLANRKDEPSVGASLLYSRQGNVLNPIVKNFTNRYAAVKVFIEIKVDNTLINDMNDYCGDTVWHLTPQFQIRGALFLRDRLMVAGYNLEQMRADVMQGTAQHQCRLSFKLEWKDEDGKRYRAPKHYWYYDFVNDDFVYQVGGFSDWE